MGVFDAIDRIYDRAEGLVDGADRVLNRHKRMEQKVVSKRGQGPHATRPAAANSATAIVRQRYRMVDAIDTESGSEVFVVTDGAERAVCSSRAMAERVRDALNTMEVP